jgi:hypothetical protein
VDWLVEASVLDKHAVFIFRPEVMSWDSEGLCRFVRGKSEGKSQSGWSDVEIESSPRNKKESP